MIITIYLCPVPGSRLLVISFPLLAAVVLSLFFGSKNKRVRSLGFRFEPEANQKELNTAQNKPELTYLENTVLKVGIKFGRKDKGRGHYQGPHSQTS